MGAVPKHHIPATQRDQLRDAQPGLYRHEQQRAIPAPEPGRRRRCRHQRFDLLVGQKGDVMLLEPLARY